MNFLICLLSLFVAALARPDFSYEFQQPLPNNGKHWAVIVAGSNGYFNYRHQVIYSYFFFGYILTAFFFIKSVTIIAVAELISKLDYSTWGVLIDMTMMDPLLWGPGQLFAYWEISQAFCHLLIIFTINFLKYSFRNTRTVKQFGSRSGPTFCLS